MRIPGTAVEASLAGGTGDGVDQAAAGPEATRRYVGIRPHVSTGSAPAWSKPCALSPRSSGGQSQMTSMMPIIPLSSWSRMWQW